MEGRMSIAWVKGYLRQIRDDQIELRHLEEQVEQLRLSFLPKAITYDKDRVQNPAGDMMADKMAKVCELDKVITAHMEDVDRHRADAMRTIRKMKSPKERVVLEMYYITYREKPMTWEQVADSLHYSVQMIYIIHGKALQSFDRLCQSAKRRTGKGKKRTYKH